MPGTRAEHLAWCKERALEYADRGDAGGAMASLMSDLANHPETAPSCELIPGLMLPLTLMGKFDDPRELRKFIEGFN